MTLPMAIARLNRRGANKVARHVVGHVPPFALIEHVGRRSGRRYRTPIMIFRTGDTWVVALTYGPDTDWVRNVLVAGSARVTYGGRTFHLDAPRLTGWEAGKRLPWLVRAALRVIRVREFLVADRSERPGRKSKRLEGSLGPSNRFDEL